MTILSVRVLSLRVLTEFIVVDFRHVLTKDPETHLDKIAVTQACFYFCLCVCM